MNAGFAAVLALMFLSSPRERPAAEVTESENLVVVPDASGRFGFIDVHGAMVIQPMFIWAKSFYHGYGEVFVCGHDVFIDRSGNLFPYHPGIAGSKNELRPRQVGKKWGFADWTDKLVIPAIFDETLSGFSEGLAPVKKGDAWGFIDTAGKFVIAPRFKQANYFHEGVADVETQHEQELLIDRTGAVLPRNYDQLKGVISEGRIPAERAGRVGYLNDKGEMVIPPQYQSGASFHGGLAAVESKGQWGYIDRGGKMVIPFQFAGAQEFSLGLAAVFLKGGRTAFINKSGEIVFYLDFVAASGFSSPGLSEFWTGDRKYGYVDTRGKIIWGPIATSSDHARPFDPWSKQDINQSCTGIPDEMKKRALTLPQNTDRIVIPPT